MPNDLGLEITTNTQNLIEKSNNLLAENNFQKIQPKLKSFNDSLKKIGAQILETVPKVSPNLSLPGAVQSLNKENTPENKADCQNESEKPLEEPKSQEIEVEKNPPKTESPVETVKEDKRQETNPKPCENSEKVEDEEMDSEEIEKEINRNYVIKGINSYVSPLEYKLYQR